MTPTETAALLRQFMDWRRDKSNWPPSPMQIEKAIDAAVEMIERLESSEKERANANAAAVNIALEAERLQCENDALRAKIAAIEKQEPVAWARKLGLDVPSFGCVTDLKYRPSNIPESSYIPLYTLPGAQTQPAPSVPVAALRPVIDWLRNGCEPQEAAKELELLIGVAPEASRALDPNNPNADTPHARTVHLPSQGWRYGCSSARTGDDRPRGGQTHYIAHSWSANAGRLIVTEWLPRSCCHSERATDAACEGCCNRGEK